MGITSYTRIFTVYTFALAIVCKNIYDTLMPMGRKPKDAKLLYLKFDRVTYEALETFCAAQKITVTAALEIGARLLMKRGKLPRSEAAKFLQP